MNYNIKNVSDNGAPSDPLSNQKWLNLRKARKEICSALEIWKIVNPKFARRIEKGGSHTYSKVLDVYIDENNKQKKIDIHKW